MWELRFVCVYAACFQDDDDRFGEVREDAEEYSEVEDGVEAEVSMTLSANVRLWTFFCSVCDVSDFCVN